MRTVHLRGETADTLARRWPDLPIDPAVARRILNRVVHEDRDDLDGITGLRRTAALSIVGRASLARLRVVDRRLSPRDGFTKYLFEARDGRRFEAVRIPLERPRWSVCVSSQAGCALGCAFCTTGRLGLERDLEAWEIVEQVLTVRREGPERPVTSVVFQGQGEPLANYDEVARAAAILRDPNGLRVRGESITVSTAGLLPGIERLIDDGQVWRLILSLTSAFDDKRAALLPVARRWAVGDLVRALVRHRDRRGGPVHLAWVLMAGVNTGAEEARELARLFRGVPVRIHLIDVDDPTGTFRAPDAAERKDFLAALDGAGLPFVRRYSGGTEIGAACGTLASAARGGIVLDAPTVGAAS